MAIQYSGTMRYQPGIFEQHHESIAEVVRKSREEPGCLAYSLARDVADPDLFILYERWESQEAFDAHFASPHVQEFAKLVKTFGKVDTNIHKFITDDGEFVR
ncbi:putative quinol monooxygenase [Altererythrobacter sp. GH1-8]|uniref:putative quinol monooxygenase n=1 Tax=Altererythrobacter sp. GH1-8 TaxID=3349333 RepID=UPI00374D0555